ncbi:MAG: DUF4397 domain-containing protein [Ferruginibacter sp.]|nr:DUF4397 domain-containing protein [Ferruginibacter sp.]
MKKIFNCITILLSAIVIGISSCNKDEVNLIDENNKWIYLDSSNSANIKIIQCFAGNTPQIPTAPNITTGPQVFIYANGKKLNGTALSYGGVFPTTNVYSNIPAGSTRFDIINARLNLSVVPNIPGFIAGDTLATFTATVDKGKYYSFYIGDTVPTVRVSVKEDNFIVPVYQTYKIRVANFLMNPLDTLTLFSVRQNAEIISNITHKNVSDWVQLPLPIISDTLVFRKKGSTAAYVQFNGFSPVGLRMYTLLGRGKTAVTSKTPAAGIIINR